jgi:hypothetical protein
MKLRVNDLPGSEACRLPNRWSRAVAITLEKNFAAELEKVNQQFELFRAEFNN